MPVSSGPNYEIDSLAVCGAHPASSMHKVVPSSKNCCGFHAYRSVQDAENGSYAGAYSLLGVGLAGQIYRHGNVYRAERQRVRWIRFTNICTGCEHNNRFPAESLVAQFDHTRWPFTYIVGTCGRHVSEAPRLRLTLDEFEQRFGVRAYFDQTVPARRERRFERAGAPVLGSSWN